MYKITLSTKSAVIAIRQNRIDSNNVAILHHANQLLLTKKRHGSQAVEIMVPSKRKTHNNWRFIYRVCSASLPKNSIQKLGENVSCIKPELLLIQLSTLLPYPHVALIALEMCGTYAIDPLTRDFIGNLKPATNSKKVKEYIKEYEKLNPHFKGKRKIKAIVDFLEEKSASPMESRLYIKLCGDRKEGFYGCRNLIMNQPVSLSEEACKIAGQPIVYPDLMNQKNKVAIEYNSAQYHETNEQGQKDRRRRDALVYDGWKVISITPQQIYDNSTFHIIALQILDLLGQSFNLNMAKFSKKRDAAFKLLH